MKIQDTNYKKHEDRESDLVQILLIKM